MLGAGVQFSRSRGDDRFNNPPTKARRSHAHDHLRRVQSDVVRSKTFVSDNSEPEHRVKPACEPVVSPLSNLERFLESVTPSVPAQYFSNTTMRGWRTNDVESKPYFVLGDLWESFKEWSAYGAGVPLMLQDTDSVVQYYVPYLSAIQIYGNREAIRLSARSRRPGEESDSDFGDTSSNGSSDCEPETGLKYSQEQRFLKHQTSEVSFRLDRLSLREHHIEDSSSDDGEAVNSQDCLLFEYLEQDPPFGREPLADKISDLAVQLPELKTLRSCDLLPHSWFSVAWYPIYRIPTGPTLKHLDACFLTFHSLHTPGTGSKTLQDCDLKYRSEIDGIPKIPLPVFGLASYKFRGSLWNSTGVAHSQLSQSLFQAADGWLRFLQVNHPDFQFFCRR